MGLFRIYYPGGAIQEKWLIDQRDYENVYKPKVAAKHAVEVDKNIPKQKAEELVYKIDQELKQDFGSDFFTTDSPMGLALKESADGVGIMHLPESQGGSCDLRFEQRILEGWIAPVGRVITNPNFERLIESERQKLTDLSGLWNLPKNTL